MVLQVHGSTLHSADKWWQLHANGQRGWQHNTCCNKVYGNKMHGGSKWRQGRRKDGHSSQVKLPVPSSAPQLSSKMDLGGWGWYNLSHILTTLPNSETNQVKLPVPSASQLSFKTSVSLLFHWGPPPSVNESDFLCPAWSHQNLVDLGPKLLISIKNMYCWKTLDNIPTLCEPNWPEVLPCPAKIVHFGSPH